MDKRGLTSLYIPIGDLVCDRCLKIFLCVAESPSSDNGFIITSGSPPPGADSPSYSEYSLRAIIWKWEMK